MKIRKTMLAYFFMVVTLFVCLWSQIDQLDKYSQHEKYSHHPIHWRKVRKSEQSQSESEGEAFNMGRKANVKVIVAYTPFYGRLFNVSTVGRTPSEKEAVLDIMKTCQYRCIWSTEQSDITSSDAVIFHMYNNLETHQDFLIDQLPERSKPDQKWILMVREPPAFYYPDQLKLLDDKFNLTVTYQQDSDVHIPYGTYWRLSSKERAERKRRKTDYFHGKNKLVAWMASNCKTSSRREEYVSQLQKHIPIDIYGKCGNLTTRLESANGFRQVMSHEYFFYIAFENSDCDDYITEKFWNSLRVGLIPIVRGLRSNYKQLAPPESYIQVESFISPEQLASYLKKVSQNRTLFERHHEWRKLYGANYKFFTTRLNWMCALCRQVHISPKKTVSIYDHFGEDTRCITYRNQTGNDRAGESVQDLTQ